MTTEARLDLVCSHCDGVRFWWFVDLDRPFDEQLRPGGGGKTYANRYHVNGRTWWFLESPGEYRLATDGEYYPWRPGPAAEGEVWDRYRIGCPNGCPVDEQVRRDHLDAAVVSILRNLHRTRVPLLRLTLGKLLQFGA